MRSVVEKHEITGQFICRVCEFVGKDQRALEDCEAAGDVLTRFDGLIPGMEVGLGLYLASISGLLPAEEEMITTHMRILKLYYLQPCDARMLGFSVHEPFALLESVGAGIKHHSHMAINDLARLIYIYKLTVQRASLATSA